jgi:tetratricopeptide (TPR) repeat protein
MRRILGCSTPALPTLLLLILPGIAAATADNRVKSLRLKTHEGFSRIVLAMEREPRFCITNRVDEHRVVLELDVVGWPPNQDLAEVADSYVKKLAILSGNRMLNGLEITMAHPLRHIRSSWRAGANELALDIYLRTETDGHTAERLGAKPQTNTVIKMVRLGTHPKFSRLEVEFSEKTSYQLQQISTEWLMLQINGAVLADEFMPVKLQDRRVRALTIYRYSRDRRNASFRIELAAPPERVEHFWQDASNRLLVDIYNVVAKSEEDQTEPSHPLVKNQERNDSSSEGKGQVGEPENAALSLAETVPDDAKRWVQSESSAGRELGSNDRVAAARKTSLVSTATAESSGDLRSGSEDTPEAVLESLIPTLAPEAADLLRQILIASREKRADEALQLAARYDEQYHDRAVEPLMLLRGDLYFVLGLQGVPHSFAEAAAAYQASNVLRGRSALQPWALLQLGRVQLRRKRYLEALGYLDLVINKYLHSPHRAIALIHRGRLYLEKDRADLALDDFQQVLSEYPEGPCIDEALMGKAISHSLRGENDQAEALFAELESRIADFYLKHPEILYYWGRNDIVLERYQQGREKLFLALNLGQQPQDTALLLAHIGDSFHTQGKVERATSYYRLTMKLFPGSDGAIVSQARLAEESSNMEMMAEIVREHPESELAEFALVRMAVHFHEKGSYREAIRVLEQLETSYPSSSLKKESRRLLRHSLQKRAKQLRSQGEYWELLALLKTTKPWLSDEYKIKAGLWEAEAYVKLSLWDDAVAALEAITPDELAERDRLQWTLLLAQTYESKGKLALAESLLQGLANIVSSGNYAWEIRWPLAQVHQKAGNHEDAVAIYRVLLEEELTETVRAKTLMAMAESLLAQGQYDRAKDVCQSVLSLTSEGSQSGDRQPAAWAALGEIHYRQGDFKLAARAYEKALQYGEKSDLTSANLRRSRLATCYDKLGARAKAKHLYQRIENEAGDLWRQMAAVSQRIQQLETRINEVKGF